MLWTVLLPFFLGYVTRTTLVEAHGRLMDPPARNSMWRFGFPNPVNYNDNELYCGGYTVQWEQNEGKCGLCGDAFHVQEPRPHEAGGMFAKGIITRHYSVGQKIDIEVELTANHYGRFEVFICPNNNYKQEASRECFERFPLYLTETKDVAFVIPEDGVKKAVFRYQVQLPPYVTCTQCVLRWIYYTGNQWGVCDNGTHAVGCGKSETFINCADIAITSNAAGAIPPLFVGQDNPYQLYYQDYRLSAPYNVLPLVVRDQVCVANSLYRLIPGIDDWCMTNCLRYPPNCPSEVCECPSTCEAVGEFSGISGADIQCMDQCLVYPSKNCSRTQCACYEENNGLETFDLKATNSPDNTI
ncbi:uncharacterized protein LOC109539607 [Dendroctonus ponderosae]|uniref:Chitin-binding type-4 domain-containing protein n=1 Tax=Dendroctonus ponderosae TaxID=77166 RepID=A0AAR5PPS6_DENPD|nr:uncharacterized protein LOC109539607 [Dendroctonus ponderosae]KAH1009354.1 hypothetical protein HUJ04_001720 [Dendroctonus ponderosae]KAH1017346.1 hypothetical protein HUJ05_008000 [Dendroctonus ponderosae]